MKAKLQYIALRTVCSKTKDTSAEESKIAPKHVVNRNKGKTFHSNRCMCLNIQKSYLNSDNVIFSTIFGYVCYIAIIMFPQFCGLMLPTLDTIQFYTALKIV
jgi:hypothetical protein